MIKWAATLLLSAFAMEAGAETIAITHARTWTGDGPEVVDATIVITDGRIVSIRAGGQVPAGSRVIDAGGRQVSPAVMNASTYLGLMETRSASDAMLSSGELGAGFDVQYALNMNSMLVPLARADGLSRAMAVPSGTAQEPFAGMGAVIRLNPTGSMLDKAQAAVFVKIGAMSKADAGGSRAAEWILLRKALAEASDAPVQSVKTGRPLTNLGALQAVVQGHTKLAIATDRESDILEAIRLAQDMKIRVVIMGGAEAWRVRRQLAAAHIPVVVDPVGNVVRTFDDVGVRMDNAALLNAAGVLVAITVKGTGAQYNPGLSVREGAGIAVAYGLPHEEAMKAITVNPAIIWGIDDRYGALTPGRDADVVIWDGDPLESATVPIKVLIGGQEVSLQTRQTALRDRYHPSRNNDPLPPAYRNN